jgi:hypothetical protein
MSMMNAADSQTTSVGMIEIMVTHALVHGMKHPACISVASTRYGSCRRPTSGTKIYYLPLFIFGRWPGPLRSSLRGAGRARCHATAGRPG